MTDYAADRLKVRHPGPVKGTTEETSVQIRLAVPLSKPEEKRAAREFILQHHYSKTVPTGKNIYFGCYVGDQLFAVADYGPIASRSEPALILGREDATRTNTLELRRLCRLGEKGERGPVKMPKFLRACHKLLKTDGYRYVLSYSDWDYNKFEVQREGIQHRSGGVYLFSGFTWLGATKEEWHVTDKDGNRFHRSKAYRRMLAHNLAVCAAIGFKVEKKPTGNRDRIWPMDLWASDELCSQRLAKGLELPAKKLWTLEQVRDAMGFKRERRQPKDKWLLDLSR
jgi:hypothetical protein